MSHDVIVDEVRRIRHELVKRYGGLDGWIQHLQAIDRERTRKPYQRTVGKRGAQAGGRRGRRAS